ncbi:MAG: sugar MFS transporter [Cytophagaceae bacterium]|jgi:FHS family L-fucose permease-like MFS transporter|nr:sugar MFS transporter [Cytophagaceae bacterium]
MASIGGNGNSVRLDSAEQTKHTGPLIMMISLYFMIGFITVMNDVLIPSLKSLFQFNENENWKAMLVQSCFFIAYGIMSFPAGFIINKVGYKKGISLALLIMGLGLFLFVPASSIVSYAFFLFALFVVAIGLAILQVALNPYITALGPAETASSRMNLGGALNSFATFIGPIIGATFILKEGLVSATEKAEAVRGPYVVLALLTLSIASVLYFVKLPKISSQEDGKISLPELVKFKHLMSGALSIFFYVGAEVAIGSLLILYLKSSVNLSEKHASSVVAYYWGSAMIGRLLGSAIGQKVSSQKLLAAVTFVALILVGASMLGPMEKVKMELPVLIYNHGFEFPVVSIPLSAFMLVLVGLFNSVMWPCIFPLGIKDLGQSTSAGSGVMVTMVVGGAFIPLLQGVLSDQIGFQNSFILILACYAYILYFALKGYSTDYLSAQAQKLQKQ